MSIFKNIVDDFKARKLEREERRMDDEYVNDILSSQYKNAYYTLCGNCDIWLHNPQKHLVGRKAPIHLETDNIPTYKIRFMTPEKAHNFIQNNFYIGIEHQKDVKISQVGSSVIIEPLSIDYHVHMEVDSEELGQQLVKILRRQYINNKRDYTIEEKQGLLSQVAESEIEKLGIKF